MTSSTHGQSRRSPSKLRPLKGPGLSANISPKVGSGMPGGKPKSGFRRRPFEGGLSKSRAGTRQQIRLPKNLVGSRGVDVPPLGIDFGGSRGFPLGPLDGGEDGGGDEYFSSDDVNDDDDAGYERVAGGRQWKRAFPSASLPDPMSVGESQALAKLLSQAGDEFTQMLVGPIELQGGGGGPQERGSSFEGFDDDASSQGSYVGSVAGSVSGSVAGSSVMSQYSRGNFEDREGGPHSIVGVQRLHGLRRDMKDLPRKQRRAIESFFRSIRLPGNRSVQAWVASYADDRSTFASKTRWAQAKLAEAQQLVEIGALPHSVLVAASMQMLVELEDKLCFMAPEASAAVTHLFRALYVIPEGAGLGRSSFDDDEHDDDAYAPQVVPPSERSAASEAARSILSRRNPARDRLWAPNGDGGADGLGTDDDAQRDRLVMFLRCTTYHEECVNTETKLDYELSLRPGMEERLAARARERRIERQIFAKISKRWARGVLWRVIDAWASILDEEKKRQRMGQVFVMMNELKLTHVFDAWQRFTSSERWLRVKNSGEDIKNKMTKLKEAVKKCGIQTTELKKQETVLKDKVVRLRETLKKQLEILHDPARQPPTLQKNLAAVTDLMKSNQECLCEQMKRNVKDVHRRGIDTARLASLYKWKGVRHSEEGSMEDILNSKVVEAKSGEVRWDSLEAESDVEEDVERTIHAWRPGTFKSTEQTPAFTPFNTRPGRRLRRWTNNTLRRAWNALGDAVPEALRPLQLFVDPDDLADAKKLKTVVSFLHVNRFHSGTVIDPRPSVDPRANRSEEGSAVWLRDADFAGKNAQELAREIVAATRKLKALPGRYLQPKDITGEEEPPSAEEEERERIRMERLKQRELDQGIIVHVMSKYMGQRVHVVDTRGPKQFAFLAELFSYYFQGRSEPAEENHSAVQLQHAIERFEGVVVSCLKLAKKGPVSFSKKELQEKAEEMRVMQHLGVTACQHLHAEWVDCLKDREAFVDHLMVLLRTAWQGLCTTVLARKVRIEEDIDDGTFTTVHQIQLANEFKRIGIEDEAVQTAQCKEMSEFLKTRIRDMKRIFSFYAASGDGPATSMDHSEFWRVVKDCKLQKDRKALPSVRIDLIFQQCNQDFSKEGKVT
jgi:hypothetical protein